MEVKGNQIHAGQGEKHVITVEIVTSGPGSFEGFAENIEAALALSSNNGRNVKVTGSKPYETPKRVLAVQDIDLGRDDSKGSVTFGQDWSPAFELNEESGELRVTNNDGSYVVLDADVLRDFLNVS